MQWYCTLTISTVPTEDGKWLEEISLYTSVGLLSSSKTVSSPWHTSTVLRRFHCTVMSLWSHLTHNCLRT